MHTPWTTCHPPILPLRRIRICIWLHLYLSAHLQGKLATVFFHRLNLESTMTTNCVQVAAVEYSNSNARMPNPLSTCCHILLHILGQKNRETERMSLGFYCFISLAICFDLCSLITFFNGETLVVFAFVLLLVIVANSLRIQQQRLYPCLPLALFNFDFSCSAAAATTCLLLSRPYFWTWTSTFTGVVATKKTPSPNPKPK